MASDSLISPPVRLAGVSKCFSPSGWCTQHRQMPRSQVSLGGKNVHLGMFDSEDDCLRARRAAEKEKISINPRGRGPEYSKETAERLVEAAKLAVEQHRQLHTLFDTLSPSDQAEILSHCARASQDSSHTLHYSHAIEGFAAPVSKVFSGAAPGFGTSPSVAHKSPLGWKEHEWNEDKLKMSPPNASATTTTDIVPHGTTAIVPYGAPRTSTCSRWLILLAAAIFISPFLLDQIGTFGHDSPVACSSYGAAWDEAPRMWSGRYHRIQGASPPASPLPFTLDAATTAATTAPTTAPTPSLPPPSPLPPVCTHGQVWNECGSACTRTCDDPTPMCNRMCAARCECPFGLVEQKDGSCITASACSAGTPPSPSPVPSVGHDLGVKVVYQLASPPKPTSPPPSPFPPPPPSSPPHRTGSGRFVKGVAIGCATVVGVLLASSLFSSDAGGLFSSDAGFGRRLGDPLILGPCEDGRARPSYLAPSTIDHFMAGEMIGAALALLFAFVAAFLVLKLLAVWLARTRACKPRRDEPLLLPAPDRASNGGSRDAYAKSPPGEEEAEFDPELDPFPSPHYNSRWSGATTAALSTNAKSLEALLVEPSKAREMV